MHPKVAKVESTVELKDSAAAESSSVTIDKTATESTIESKDSPEAESSVESKDSTAVESTIATKAGNSTQQTTIEMKTVTATRNEDAAITKMECEWIFRFFCAIFLKTSKICDQHEAQELFIFFHGSVLAFLFLCHSFIGFNVSVLIFAVLTWTWLYTTAYLTYPMEGASINIPDFLREVLYRYMFFLFVSNLCVTDVGLQITYGILFILFCCIACGDRIRKNDSKGARLLGWFLVILVAANIVRFTVYHNASGMMKTKM